MLCVGRSRIETYEPEPRKALAQAPRTSTPHAGATEPASRGQRRSVIPGSSASRAREALPQQASHSRDD